MADIKDRLRLARDKWVPTALAEEMIWSVAPPSSNGPTLARRWLKGECRSGRVRRRFLPDGLNSYERAAAARRGWLAKPERECSLYDIIRRLLDWRSAEEWPVPVEPILALATASNDDLPELALQRSNVRVQPKAGRPRTKDDDWKLADKVEGLVAVGEKHGEAVGIVAHELMADQRLGTEKAARARVNAALSARAKKAQ